MQPHFVLSKGDKHYLLLRSSTQFHIITADKRLTPDAENWLLAEERSTAAMNERQLSRHTIEKTELRGVAIGGCEAGSVLQFYLKSGKHRYALSDDYTMEELNQFFWDVEYFTPPKLKRNTSSDWRASHQQPEVMQKLRWTSRVLSVLGVVLFGLLLVFGCRYRLLCAMALLSSLVSLALYFAFPYYFTLIQGKKKYGEKDRSAIDLDIAVMFPLMGLVLENMRYAQILDWQKLLLLVFLVTAAMTVLAVWRSVEMRSDLWRIVAFVILCAFLSVGGLQTVNVVLDFGAVKPQNVQVVDMQIHESRRSETYYCCVILDDREVELPVSRSEYEMLSIGSYVDVTVHEGALGISYAVYEE